MFLKIFLCSKVQRRWISGGKDRVDCLEVLNQQSACLADVAVVTVIRSFHETVASSGCLGHGQGSPLQDDQSPPVRETPGKGGGKHWLFLFLVSG